MVKKILKWLAVLVVGFGLACVVLPGLWMIPLYVFGGYRGLGTNSPLLEAHQRAVNSFVESEGFGIERIRQGSFWNEYQVQLAGERFKPEKIQLIGLTEEYGDRYFDERHPPKKEVLDKSIWRETTPEEDEAIYEIRSGADLSKRISGNSDNGDDGSFRVLAPIMAAADCMKCHEVKEGEVIGAFAYTLIPMGPVDEVSPSEAEVPEIKASSEAVPRARSEP